MYSDDSQTVGHGRDLALKSERGQGVVICQFTDEGSTVSLSGLASMSWRALHDCGW